MKKAKLFVLVGFAFALYLAAPPDVAFAETHPASLESDEALIDELVSTPDLGIVYVADGAGDGSVLNDKPIAAVKKIVRLRDKAIPLLIKHLNDTRKTSAKYKGGKHWTTPVAVPVGYLCLDILGQIVADNKTLFVDGHRDCETDGMGACIRPKYYFNPDDYSTSGDDLFPNSKVLAVKQNWETARKAGLLKFRPPSWLERFKAAYSTN